MSELINVMTLVRPIRKLFVIEDGDLSTFAKIVEFCSEDLNGIRTLILLNDERLFSKNTVAAFSIRSRVQISQRFQLVTAKKFTRSFVPGARLYSTWRGNVKGLTDSSRPLPVHNVARIDCASFDIHGPRAKDAAEV